MEHRTSLYFQIRPALALIAGVLVALSLASLDAHAQEKIKYSFGGKAASTKYVQQHSIDVGDVPGHQLRLAELVATYAADAPEYGGVKAVEGRTRLTSDYTDNSGRMLIYVVLHMANGDRIYQRAEGLTHTSVAADGSRKTAYSTVTTITGGTGKFATIRGLLRTTGFTDFKVGTSGASTEGEYWFEK
jgi:hypothetical protein